MHGREFSPGVHAIGAVDWDRRLFDSLIPLPDGTSYNAYFISGNDKNVLIDSVDPSKSETLLEQLSDCDRLDYIVSNHSEQDHSGAIPEVLERFPDATVLASAKGTDLLKEHLHIPTERLRTVEDGEQVSLGGKTLEFHYTPWVHWPETMITYLPENKIAFTCDFFGSHLAKSDLFVTDKGAVYEAAKRYYAEIMMPFRPTIRKNIEKMDGLDIQIIAPSHGPMYNEPDFIVDAYRDWVSDSVQNSVVIPYISMHGSTRKMVEHLVSDLTERDIKVHQFDLAVTDLGKLAITLVDAASIIIATPTVHVRPHPIVYNAVNLANALRPKLRYASVVNSYGWGTNAVQTIAELIPNLKVEVIEPVVCKGAPAQDDFAALDRLADDFERLHKVL